LVVGKWWGDKNVQPVVGLHGLLDNAATFDKLAPLLETPSFLSLDAPGHGKSSHLPPGIILHYYDNVVFMRYLLKNHFKWDNLTLMGHSFGASIWYHYASFFPGDVKKYIAIDPATHAMAPNEKKVATDSRKIVEAHLKIEKKKEGSPPEHTFEELVEIMYLSRKDMGLRVNMGITKEGCRTLTERGSQKSHTGKYYFTRDLKLNSRSFGRSTLPFIHALAEQMTCEVLYIRGSKGIIIEKWLEACEKSIQGMQKKSKRVEYINVDGGHHLHLETPDRVAPVIKRFLNSKY
jgi:pimeloyl-ACP methyl ester carboxylesterase